MQGTKVTGKDLYMAPTQQTLGKSFYAEMVVVVMGGVSGDGAVNGVVLVVVVLWPLKAFNLCQNQLEDFQS
ncbi:hypothetical protein E2C01_065562 [Portunus trituberculatus]|uniref:Uncharacterized protein n=1 Tax=Portunus trituberculatus TaxID=210409 RepID=A0A5B7HFW6_PORTR|nr:hypothetical protein [Portunus trituberculatus]